MKSTDRIELELKVREVAIQIASQYGEEGIHFFHSEFLPLAQEYTEGCNQNERERTTLPFQVKE